VDIEPQFTVGDLKTKVEESQGFPAAHQKLIHAGKVLVDDATIESCNIKEKDFLVVMVTKVIILELD
jgi:UV excision repair protein RAD23